MAAGTQAAAKATGAYLETQAEETAALLCSLIETKSLSGDEGAMAALVEDTMRGFGFDAVTRDKYGSVLGRVGSGKTVVLMDAHIDTVAPGTAAEWGFEPLAPKVENGFVHGRGAVDDKGSLAAMLLAGKALKACGLEGNFTLLVSASVCEESMTGVCVKNMVANMPKKPDYVVVAEPSSNQLMRGHRGRALIGVEVTGKAAHASAAHMGDNALTKALPTIRALDEKKDFADDPVLGQGTLEVTMCEAFTPSLNTVPGKVEIICDRRLTAGESESVVLAEVAPAVAQSHGRAYLLEKTGTTYTGQAISGKDYCPSWYLPVDHPAVAAGLAACEATLGEAQQPGTWTFCTNATYLAGEMGIACVGFGPGDGALCHTPMEKIAVAEVQDAAKFYAAYPFFVTAAE